MAATDNNRSKEELSQAILHTASRLFTEHGIEAVSMHQIAKCAGIGQGTLYRRYANKADLCMEMMHDHFEHFRTDIESYLSDFKHENPKVKIRSVVSFIIRFLELKSKWLQVIQSQQLNEGMKNGEEFFHSLPYQFLHGVFTRLLKEGAPATAIRSKNAEFIAHSYISILSPYTCMHLANAKGYTSGQVEEEFGDSFVDPLFVHE
ncbi:TetR/AcrR family transcriptional regulator [Paenibacillus sp. LHD-117]|uniref:TetR/AcrR family transcriptional regulator n=1 Tax=Paenibacillus sp. LHD-117 TaxID=3071412 RepID=UPI0027DF4B59|nr:TetR/AcrR family transcriptional regulator [Paenibacillus sp. LHD-117]MDQ6419173.1 TetR/AcrR family transcriptional regulator [Paenibacillus sp. LHD-117]